MSQKGSEKFFQSNPSSRRNILYPNHSLESHFLNPSLPLNPPRPPIPGADYIYNWKAFPDVWPKFPSNLTENFLKQIHYYSLCSYHLFICRVIAVYPQSCLLQTEHINSLDLSS